MRETVIPVPGTSGLQARLHHADEPRALMVLVHGFGEHSGRYGRTTRFLTDRGITVAAYDLRGHGTAPGPRARVAMETHIRDNLAVRDAVLEWARSDEGGGAEALPRLLMGHSMGGLIAGESALRRPWDLKGLVLSSPGLVVGEGTPAPLRALAPVIARLLPFLPVEKLDPREISRVPEYVKDYTSDPLVHHKGVPAVSAGTMLAGGLKLIERSRALRLPTLVLNGSADTITSPTGSRRFAQVAGTDHDPRPEITYREIEGGLHELFNDLCADEAYEALGEWLDARLG
ncbi:alpha/beta hydrolase [Dietzia cinnamea]|uniref:alpha/beta hydrolase n=1 Tax=Dietzia cinnamea TaxID=321318 RepID=UPI00223ABC5D|nr:alpha/beta hydrolase [Dietzia cinnamea]MCT2062774.1 alpha/beta hydrolase [Dietzia cinnamea]MCT2237615.1 alpha/beta hydrolase [Dietzia cinnamea]MCT2302415.1 alpha/beta hydrolase [Dietzia cinnamea]